MSMRDDYDILGLRGWKMLKREKIRRLLETGSPYSPDGTATREVIMRNFTILFRLLCIFSDTRGCSKGIRTIASLFGAHGGESSRLTFQVVALWKYIVGARERYLDERKTGTQRRKLGGASILKRYPVATAGGKKLLVLIDKVCHDMMIHGDGEFFVLNQTVLDSKAIVRDWKEALAINPQGLVENGLPGYATDDEGPEADDPSMTGFIDEIADKARQTSPATRVESAVTSWLANLEATPANHRPRRKLGTSSPAGAEVGKRARAQAGDEEETGGGEGGRRSIRGSPPPADNNSDAPGQNGGVPAPTTPVRQTTGNGEARPSDMFVTPNTDESKFRASLPQPPTLLD
ncbi:hypothetical protein OQA88_5758 [Cercophora sp. LCS_1]